MNLLSSRLVPLVLVAIGQQYTTTKQHATLVLAFTPPPTLFATARGPIAKKGGGFSSCTVQQLKARTNDDDDDDDDKEKDGLDSLMGKKLGINIGAQL